MQVPIDAGSLAEPFFAPDAKAFMHDAKAFGALSHSVKVDASMAGQSLSVCAEATAPAWISMAPRRRR